MFSTARDLFSPRTSVRIWLVIICVMLVTMVSIGGITRLTGSGLSITDWKPIMGAIPPLNDADWEVAFEKYRQIPQYRLVNEGMPLSEFKFIFFWEWFHRLLGRLIGIVVLLPGAFFFVRGHLGRPLAKAVCIGFLLGGLQGALGWFMVMSGLTERVSVSHYRLAAHFGLALVILAYFVSLTRAVFTGDRALAEDQVAAADWLRPKFRWLVALFAIQIVYGAFVAGMKAGFAFNTFPLMAGHFAPPNLWELTPVLANLVDNPATVQWIHRQLGWIAFLAANGIWIGLLLRRTPRGSVRRWTTGLAHMTLVQFLLGVATLVYGVPLGLGVAHQAGAAMIVVILSLLGQTLRTTPTASGINASH